MFQTLQPESIRINKTALPRNRQQIHLGIDLTNRPNTVNFDRSFEAMTPKQNVYKTLDSAQLQLTLSFRKEMSPFIKQKIRSSLSRNNKRRIIFSRSSSYSEDPQQQSERDKSKFMQTIDSLNHSSPLNVKQMKICTLLNRKTRSLFKNQEFISQSIITNTKEKIDRLIGMKRQKEEKYQQLRKSIEEKCSNFKNHFRKLSTLDPGFQNKPPTMETLKWDKQWKDQTKKQSNRYRNRLMAKHKRDMSMKIQVPQKSVFNQN